MLFAHGALRRKEIVMGSSNGRLNVVLVHGGFVDGSGWEDVRRTDQWSWWATPTAV
jgi:hypothetical protein